MSEILSPKANGKTQWVVGAFLSLLLAGFLFFAGKDRDHISDEVIEAKERAEMAQRRAEQALDVARANKETLAVILERVEQVKVSIDDVKKEVRENRKIISN